MVFFKITPGLPPFSKDKEVRNKELDLLKIPSKTYVTAHDTISPVVSPSHPKLTTRLPVTAADKAVRFGEEKIFKIRSTVLNS